MRKKKSIDQFSGLKVDQTPTALGRSTHVLITAARFQETKDTIWHRFHFPHHAQKTAGILRF